MISRNLSRVPRLLSFVRQQFTSDHLICKCSTSHGSESRIIEPEAYAVAERRKYVMENISEAIANPTNRLFAIVYIQSKQFKVSQDDIIHLEHNIPLDIGQEIKLEKVLLVGGASFTLVGRPLLNPRYVNVTATVIEKSTTSPDVSYDYKSQDINSPIWLSRELTVLRINNINVDKTVMGEA